jgi:hypothetical protein
MRKITLKFGVERNIHIYILIMHTACLVRRNRTTKASHRSVVCAQESVVMRETPFRVLLLPLCELSLARQ